MVTVTQDVPVTVLTGSQMREITEPQVPAPDVRRCSRPSIYLVKTNNGVVLLAGANLSPAAEAAGQRSGTNDARERPLAAGGKYDR